MLRRHDASKRRAISYVNKFELIANHHLVGIAVLVLAKSSLVPFIKNVQCGTASRGIGGVLGNKGGVGVSMMLYESRYIFFKFIDIFHISIYIYNVSIHTKNSY